MATIVVLRHRFDAFRLVEPRVLARFRGRYMLAGVLEVLRRRGHRILHSNRPERAPPGDLLFLHVDCSVVPDAYLAAAARYPAAINAAVHDITKRRISSLMVTPGDGWDGPVFVKTNLNFHARPERVQNRNALMRLRRPPHAGLPRHRGYRRYESPAEVPDAVWRDPAHVVERFVTEEIDGLYASRTYVFCGPAERCTLSLGRTPYVKAHTIVRSVPAEVPAELREIRARLRFDYGKFDFIMLDGRPVLLDANKATGGVNNPALAERIRAGHAALADGVESFLPPALPPDIPPALRSGA